MQNAAKICVKWNETARKQNKTKTLPILERKKKSINGFITFIF